MPLPQGIDIEVRYMVIEPDGEYYRSCATKAAAEDAARFKSGCTDYSRAGYVVRPRICRTLVVHGHHWDPKQYVEFVGGSQ